MYRETNTTMTKQEKRVLYQAAKGANLLGALQVATGLSRMTIWTQFNDPNATATDEVLTHAKRILKDAGILNNYQLLTELLND